MARWLSALALATALAPSVAHARPLDTDDASVPEPGRVELELGVAFGQDGLFAPVGAAVGLGGGIELSLATEGSLSATDNPPGHTLGLGQSAIGLKLALLEAVAVAASVGAAPDAGLGGGVALILTQPLDALALHANVAAAWTGGTVEMALSIALEGPAEWVVRPVGELGVASADVQPSAFVTVGAVLTASDALALDVAVHATAEGAEGRVGITVASGG